MLIDTHCHLDDSAFSHDRDEVIARAKVAGVAKLINPGVSPLGWHNILRLSAANPCIYPAFGVHPMHAGLWSSDTGVELDSLLSGSVATGEIGLDYQRSLHSREIQMIAFREQLKLSVHRGVPVILHCRKAFADLLRICREEHVDKVGGVMHAFSGSVEVAEECLRLGLLISVAGTITFSNAIKPLNVVRSIPLERLLLETDAPDLPPEPYRTARNEPAWLPLIAQKVGVLKGVSPQAVSRRTTANAVNLFRFSFFENTKE